MPTIPFESVQQAIVKAIALKEYADIDAIVEFGLNNFTQVEHSKTPIFAAVEEVLGKLQTDEAHPHALESVATALNHLFASAEKALNSDREILGNFVHLSCNHVSHTSLLPEGGTVKDLLDGAGEFSSRFSMFRENRALYKLLKNSNLMSKKEVANEELYARTAPKHHVEGRML